MRVAKREAEKELCLHDDMPQSDREIECPNILVMGGCSVGKSSIICAVMSGCVKSLDTDCNVEYNPLVEYKTSFIEANPLMIMDDENRVRQLCQFAQTSDAIWIVVNAANGFLSVAEFDAFKHYLNSSARILFVVTHVDVLREKNEMRLLEERIRQWFADLSLKSDGSQIRMQICMVDATGSCPELLKYYSELCVAKRNKAVEAGREAFVLAEYRKYAENGLLSFDFDRYRDSITYYCIDHSPKAVAEYYENCKPPFALTDLFKERIRKILQMPPPDPLACSKYAELYEIAAKGHDLIQAIEFGFPYWRDNAADEDISSKAKYVVDILEALSCEMGVAGNWPSVADDVIAVLEYASKRVGNVSGASGSSGGTGMGKTGAVFISYSHCNKDVADALVDYLMSHDVPCWYAPQDIEPGEEYPESIDKAIRNAECFILIFSNDSNKSKQCKRELHLATEYDTRVIPFRIEDVAPSGSMNYYLASLQWIDAFPCPDKFFGVLLSKLK